MKRFISLVLAALMLVGMCTFCAGAADEKWVDSGIDYTESTETFDLNPGRGFAPYRWYTLRKDDSPKPSDRITSYPTGCYDIMFDLGDFSGGNDYQIDTRKDNSSQIGGEDLLLGRDALQAIRDSYQAAREQGVQLITRFAYTPDDYVGTEPGNFNVLLGHIEQVSEVINEYKDVILAVGVGMIGPWGEMHSSKYGATAYANEIIKTWVKNLDDDVMLQLRNAGYLIHYIGTNSKRLLEALPFDENNPAYRFGFWNDGYLGTAWDYGTWVTTSKNFTRAEGIQFLKTQGLRVPYGGELAYADLSTMQSNDAPVWWKDRLLKELYDTHLQYLHNIYNGPTPEQELRKEIFNMVEFGFKGMPDISAYEGQNMSKVMLDHMGYRFVIRKAETTGTADKGDVIRLRGKIENVGFGNLLSPVETELAIVAPDGTGTVIPVGIDPRQWQTVTTSDYDITMTVPANAAAGEYKVYLRLAPFAYGKGETKTAIHIANNGIWNTEYDANYIGSFTVTDKVCGRATEFASSVSDRFSDVPAGEWYYDAVQYAHLNGLMSGMSKTEFAPSGQMTRAMIVEVLYRLDGKPAVDAANPFNDVPATEYYYNSVRWAAKNGIVNGKGDGKFAPKDNMTRQEFAAVLYRYAKYKGIDTSAAGDLSGFPDKNKVESWALEAITWANGTGIIGGKGQNIAPRDNATRAETATMLMRYIRLISK